MLGRYEDLGLLGTGAMAEVRRVRDPDLKRIVAMKILRPGLAATPAALARFVEEAQATAQLEHPGIVPLHEIGHLDDGRVYFTMREVRGRTLAAVLSEGEGWSRRRLLDVFLRVCEAVGYAHARGVLHRDLKPENIMVGSFGEVLVLDWGLAKLYGDATPDEAVDMARGSAFRTRAGQVAGTPMYMAPEQARGDLGALSPASDVYALGALLYELLSGTLPYAGDDAREILDQVLAGPPPPLSRQRVPAELAEVCERAMAREPDDRYLDASALAADIAAWLDGARRREQALMIVADAQQAAPEVEALRARAATLRAEAQAALAAIGSWEPESTKAEAWAREDEAERLEERAEARRVETAQLLRAALTHLPELPEAHSLLAEHYRERHAQAEANHTSAVGWELLLRAHDDGRHAAYLAGDGAVTVTSDPDGAEVELFRYVRRNRRLVAEFVRSLGPAPIVEMSLPMGSWLFVLHAPGRAEVRYPVSIGRQERWDGVRPGDSVPHPIQLPRASEIGEDEVYVPAGPFSSGGDEAAPVSLPGRRLWCDAFVMRRFPISNVEFIQFLDALVAEGREEEALRYAPHERAGLPSERGAMLYGRDAAGRFVLREDAEGDVWLPYFPVFFVDRPAAVAFAAWEAERTGLPWRLPAELEWERAARGADGRIWPWGDFLDPSWCCMRDSHASKVYPKEIGLYPVDESPFGVRDMAGGVQEWCLDRFERDGASLAPGGVVRVPAEDPAAPLYVARGGAWTATPPITRTACRSAYPPSTVYVFLGFRLARSWP